MIKSTLRPWVRALKKTDLIWRYGSNFRSTVSFNTGRRTLTSHQQRLINDLNENGVAATTFGDLFGGDVLWHDLELAASDLLTARQEEITELKANADNGAIGDKTFNLECLGSEVMFDLNSIFAALALNSSMVAIANEYLGMHAKLRYYNVWYTAASSSKPRESQLWHFDREDNYILKVFLYLDDVDLGTGPFTYAPKTHRKGAHRSARPDHITEGGVRRTTDEQMSAVVPETTWVRGTGKKGTIIFADTRGYHKGGEARTRDRLMYTCMYTSPASESKNLLKFPADLHRAGLSVEQLRILGLS